MSDDLDPVDRAQASGHPLREAMQSAPLSRILREVVAAIMEDTPAVNVSTGFSDLDSLTGGLAEGALWVVSGRSGVGKSVLVSDLIRATAVRHGQATLLITRSAPPAQVVQRLLAAEGKVALHHMKSGLSDDEGAQLRKTMDKLVDVPLVVAQVDDLDLAVVRAQVASQQGDDPLRLLLVDDLPAGPSQVQMVTELRELAVEHQLAVVAVAQEDVDDAERQMRRIEQSADVALTVHRDDQDDFHSPRAGEADFIITRHRNGPIAKITVHFQGHYGRFVDPPPEWFVRSATTAQQGNSR